MDKQFYFNQGFESYKPYLSVFDTNPHKRIDDLKDGVKAFQPEATFFYNGWEAAKRKEAGIDKFAIFLDDFRFPNWINYINYPLSTSWEVVRHYDSFTETVNKNFTNISIISLDFDLDQHKEFSYDASTYKNGLDCAQWLINYCENSNLNLPMIAVHSQNPNGGPEIYKTIQEYLKTKT